MGAALFTCMMLALSLGGRSVSELRHILMQRGISTTGVYERDELVRMVKSSGGEGAVIVSPQQPIEEMHVQDVMAELETRGVTFDVLTPTPVLYERLRLSRRGDAKQGNGRPCRQQAGPPTSRTPQADDHVTGSPPPVGGVDVESAWLAAQREVLQPFADSVGAAVEHLKPVANTAVTAAAAPRKRIVERLRARLRRVRLPSKPVLLAACIGALRFGVVQTTLAAISLGLTIDIVREMNTNVRTMCKGRRPRIGRREQQK